MDNKELISFFKKLLATSSYDPLKSDIPDLIINLLNKNHIDYEIMTSNGIRNIVAKTSGKPRVILNAHWDTVLPSSKFSSDTLEVSEKDGFIYGIGACDMKGGVIAMIACFIECARENIEGIILCLVGDEEVGGKNGTAYLVKQNILAPYVILGETTDLALSLGQKGIIEATVMAHGKEAHGAYPYRGENAILKMYLFIQEVLRKFPVPGHDVKQEDVFNMTTVSINQIKGGTSPNVVPGLCVAKVDVRVSAKSSLEATEKEFLKLAKKIGVEISFIRHGIGWEFDKHSKISMIGSKAVAKITKKPARFIKKLGSNDGKHYLDHGLQIVNIGPGTNKLIHTSEEKILPQEIIMAKNIYLEIIKNL